MRKKVLFGVDYTDNELLKVVLYLFVGGTAAVAEWTLFYVLLNYIFKDLPVTFVTLTMAASAIAFILSTLYHYFLGNILVFDSGSIYGRREEIGLVFLVSITGLLFNLILMYIFVGLFDWDPMVSKVLASCILVIWNYLARRKWIFGS
ncbi:MAG: GtrA family protein [Phascolarctobacterium sp.]|nr:GtrA family protein [Phascolarctobacterium sp.]